MHIHSNCYSDYKLSGNTYHHPGTTSEGTTDSKMAMVTVPVLSAVIGVLAVILITSIIVIIIAAMCIFMTRRNKGKVPGVHFAYHHDSSLYYLTDTEEVSPPAPHEGPVELKDVHKKNSEEQERSVDPTLLPNPAYEPLEVSEPEYL